MNMQNMGNKGMNMQNMGNNGMNMQNIGNNGMNIQNIGNKGMNMQNMGNSGMNMQNMGNSGMNMQNMGNSGMNIQNMVNSGMNMQNIGNNGMNMQNMGNSGMNIQNMGNRGMNIQNMGNNGMNMQNMGNIGMNMQSMGKKNIKQNMFFPGMIEMQMNMNLQGINIEEENEDWLYGYKITINQSQVNKKNNLSPQTNNFNCIFKTTQGVITNISINREKTMEELIQLYLKKIGKYKLNNYQNDIFLVFNAQKISLNDKRTVKEFFHNTINPIIMVNEIQNVMGAKK
jgi:hypothetical protein